jgi:hypothetical protein
MKNTISSLFAASALALAVGLSAGCSTTTPTINTATDARVSFDGLNEVTGTNVDEAWARVDLDLTPYSKIMLESVGIEYRPDGETRKSSMARSTATHFEVTDVQKERLESIMRDAFVNELGKSQKYTLVSESGPDVLLLRGGLLDVVSFVPPDTIGRSEVFLREVGEATLVLELHDSVTEAILARIIDRRAAEAPGQDIRWSNNVNNATEVRRLANYWARALRESLDTFEGWN